VVFFLYKAPFFCYAFWKFRHSFGIGRMRLKRLEISGFKSFRDKLVLEFDQGISAIVGPNGCGKSNIADAIRWVMGEQRLKMLRGRRMDDVIFNGSEESTPVDLAEVAITLVSDGRPFPGDYAVCEGVTVSRRTIRGEGENEYTINGVPCRLLDVKEFFMDTGVGARSYSFVEQSSVITLVEAKPEDRRQFIEEAAGIAKYKNRKESALRKMESTRENMMRLGDIFREVKSQLNAITKQAKRAEQFRAMKQRIREGEIALALQQYSGLHEERVSLAATKEAVLQSEQETQTRLQSLDASHEELKARVAEHESLLATQQEDFYGKKNRITAIEHEVEFSKRKVQDLGLRKQRSMNDQAILVAKKEATAAEMETLRKVLEQTKAEIESVSEAVAEKERQAEATKARESDLQRDIEVQKNRHVECVTEKARLKNLLSSLVKGKEDLQVRLEKEERERSEEMLKRERTHHALEDLRGHLLAKEQTLLELKSRREALATDCEKMKDGLQHREQSIEAIREEESRKSARYHSMKEVQEHYEWCSDGVKLLMTKGRQESLSAETVIGLVADHIQVPKQYEAAVEAVLGDKLQYVLVRSQEDGARAIDYLKSHHLGRGSFVPLKVRQTRYGQVDAGHLKEAVRLIDEVKVPDDLKDVADYLLGDVLVIPTLDDGIVLWRKNGFMGTFVTPEGDMISPHGVLSGGSNGSTEKSLLKNKRETVELEAELQELSRRLREEIEKKSSLRRTLNASEDELDKLRTDIHRLEIRVAGVGKDLERFEENARLIDQKLQILDYERESHRSEIHTGSEQIEQATKDLMGLEEMEMQTNDILSDLQEKLQVLKAEIESGERDLTANRIQLVSTEQKRSADLVSVARLESSLEDIARQEAAQQEDIIDLDRQVAELDALVEERLKELGALYGETEQIQDLLGQMRDAHQETEAGIRQLDQQIRDARKVQERIKSEFGELEIRDRELAYQMEGIHSGIREKYSDSRDLQEAVEQFVKLDEATIIEIASQLERDRLAVETFGEVNLMAVQECEQLQERHDFLSTQISDLNTSLQTLQKTITRMNRISRRRFAEAFEAVSESFKRVFPRLFPGGKGELVLTNEEDLLEAGVDMHIQVPGKRTQNVTLLSGGEKSMAAIALIFAIIMHRPSPFVLLDEVDAALDDANNSLYNGILKEIAQNSQIIMITHNKQSMEAASKLYGVTMQKQGISTLVSVQLH